jgi:hypothetical protein
MADEPAEGGQTLTSSGDSEKQPNRANYRRKRQARLRRNRRLSRPTRGKGKKI